MIEVSVVIPVYNGEETISRTLDSLSEQTYKDFEVIACIDGTHDNSEDILKQYIPKFKKLTVYKNATNRGLGPTMNRLLSVSIGKYIAVAEQDDYYYPDRLELQVNVLNMDQSVGLVSGIAEFWGGKKVNGKFPGILVNGRQYPNGVEMFMLNYRNHLKVVNSCMMFRRSVHVDNGLYFTAHYPSISIDWTYILRFSLVSKIYGINKVLVRLDRRAERNSVTSNKKQQFVATRELLRSFFYEHSNIIKHEDFDYAMRTQNLLEISSKTGLNYILVWLKFFVQNPFEKRYIQNFKKRLMLKLKTFK